MLFFYTTGIKAFLSYFNKFLSDDQEITNCHEKNGTSVFKVYVTLDEGALFGLSGSKPSIKGISDFFGSIFDEINIELQPYGVQLHGNYTEQVSTFPYDRSKCLEGNPAMMRSIIANNVLLNKHPDGYGFRLVVFFCPNMLTPLLHGKMGSGCSTVAGFLFGSLPVLKKVIRNELVSAFFGTNVGGMVFNKMVCKKARDCITSEDTIFGKYVGDLKSVRHISDGKFILNDGDKMDEHDLYDDIYVKRYEGK